MQIRADEISRIIRDQIQDYGKKVSTTLDKKSFLEVGVVAVKNITKDGMHFEIDHVMQDGDYVAIFGRSNGESTKGRKYSNVYCWRMKFRGEKICEFLEYCDTHHAREVLFE